MQLETARARVQQRQKCGIPERHAKFRAWSELDGPPKYLTTLQAVRRFSETGDTILALIGRRGTGKTQLGAVAIWQTIEQGRAARWATLLELLDDSRSRYGSSKGPADSAWLREWSAPHLLVIDEFTERLETEHARVMFTSLADARYRNCRPTILIGNVEEADFVCVVGSSIADRCNEGGGGFLVCDWPSFRPQNRTPNRA